MRANIWKGVAELMVQRHKIRVTESTSLDLDEHLRRVSHVSSMCVHDVHLMGLWLWLLDIRYFVWSIVLLDLNGFHLRHDVVIIEADGEKDGVQRM